MLTDLQGQIERITYTKDENGYTIAKLKVYGSGLIKGIGPDMAKRIVKKSEKGDVKGGIWLSRNPRIFLTPRFYSCYHAAEELGG